MAKYSAMLSNARQLLWLHHPMVNESCTWPQYLASCHAWNSGDNTFFRMRMWRRTVNASEKPTRCSLGGASSLLLVYSSSGRIRPALFNPCESVLIETYQPKWITYSIWLTWQSVWSSFAHLWFDLLPVYVAKNPNHPSPIIFNRIFSIKFPLFRTTSNSDTSEFYWVLFKVCVVTDIKSEIISSVLHQSHDGQLVPLGFFSNTQQPS